MPLHDGFDEIGKRMLLAWAEGVRGLRDERTYSAPGWSPGPAFFVEPTMNCTGQLYNSTFLGFSLAKSRNSSRNLASI